MIPNYVTNDYNIYIIEPDGKSFYFPYVLCVPMTIGSTNTLFVESNNEENPEDLGNSARGTINYLLKMMEGSSNKSPIFFPILPTNGIDSRPYFQQLSNECFDGNLPVEQQRIDLQLINAIEDAKLKFLDITKKKLEDKIFMHGYSASGVFAQRFALIHPEIIGGVCIGGAIGSIPMPMEECGGIQLDYPAGTNNYEELFGKPFDIDAYKQIQFGYYVAEKEGDRLSSTRVKEDGTPAPMHDMSYMDRSMPNAVGQNLRNAFGKDMFDRCKNQLSIYKEMGLNISAHQPFKGMHNEIGTQQFKYIYDCLSHLIATQVME